MTCKFEVVAMPLLWDKVMSVFVVLPQNEVSEVKFMGNICNEYMHFTLVTLQ